MPTLNNARKKTFHLLSLMLTVRTKQFFYTVVTLLIYVLTSSSGFARESEFGVLNVAQNTGNGQIYSLSLQTLLILSALSFLPTVLLMMTSFTRIVIVLSFLRQAIGAPTVPSNQIVIGLALFLTYFVMNPVLQKIHTDAYQPYSEQRISLQNAFEIGIQPVKAFMLKQTREADLAVFIKLSRSKSIEKPEDTPMAVLIPSFLTSELKSAFQIGFTIFIPFLIIDMVIASVLMSMGMMMVSPATIALPFKLMIFVLVDGWQLLVGSLVESFF
jgi:flagellar biosynthetic protein FliP